MNKENSIEVVTAKTTKYFGARPGEIQVLNYEHHALVTAYQVRYAGKFYNCRVYYGDVSCLEPGR